MNQVPDHMDHDTVYLLNAMNAIGRYHEAIIGYIWKAASVLPSQGQGQHIQLFGGFQGIDQVGRFTAGTEGQYHVTRPAQYFQLIDINAGKIDVIANGRNGSNVGHERYDRKSPALFDDRMIEFYGDMQGIAQASSVSDHEHFFTILKATGHFPAHIFDLFGVLIEEFFLHLGAFPALPEDHVPETILINIRMTLVHKAVLMLINALRPLTLLQVTSILVIGGTGPFCRYHGGTERVLRRTSLTEGGAIMGLLYAFEHQATDAFR